MNDARHGFPTTTPGRSASLWKKALVNAIKHGNKLDGHKKVHVECRVTSKRAEIVIEDEGPGF